MGNEAFVFDQVVACVIDYKWAIISALVGAIILGWIRVGKKWSNVLKVFCAGTFSIVILDILFNWFEFYSKDSIDTLSAGFWNFIILIVSAPVAFVIWHFRDENNRQQIENQRKDINLKEFQKLSEWVSGAHLPEIKTVSKTTQKSSSKDGAEITEQTTEQSEEYSKKPDTADFDTFSKREGAVALQISAIYNLLPFFRGDYGESFRRPAFNLLKSAWQAMQQDSLKKLDGDHLSDEERKKIFDELTQKAKSPMGVALTQVLLSLNREYKKLNLRDFPEMLPNICFAGMDFQLSGVDEIAKDLSGLKLQGANFQNAIFNLMDNAVKYKKPDGPLDIYIRTWNDDDFLYLSVKDTGIGIKKDDVKKVFEKFYRVHTGNLHNVKGFGLGLAYVKKIIDVHKGEIFVESEYGKGTKFTIKLPIIKD